MNRVHQLFNDGSTVPTAFVTVGRQRVKQYGNTVYLNNGDEFQVELFNPTTNKVLAKIELNGVSLGSGIVLRPAERVFLERYLNEAKRFLFETYEVDGNNPVVQKAIANNGDVAIKFYCETPPPVPYVSPTIWTTTYWPPITYPTYSYYSHTGNPTFGTLNNTGTVKGATGESMLYSSSVNFAPQMDIEEPAAPTKSMETGRIEKGSNSNQSFGYDHSSFNTFWSWKTEWKILPMSQKPLVQEDLKIYCSSCGRRRKKSENYCPVCGCKY